MLQHLKFNRLEKTAALILIVLGSSLFLVGCQQLYKFLGLTDQQTADQVAKDQTAITHVLDTGRQQLYQITTAIAAALGTLVSGFLAKWLNTEKKITQVLITGIETDNDNTVKATIHRKALDAGIESKLNKRVKALT